MAQILKRRGLTHLQASIQARFELLNSISSWATFKKKTPKDLGTYQIHVFPTELNDDLFCHFPSYLLID